MKKTILLILMLAAAGLASGHAQGTWTQKADFGGGERSRAAGFSIGSKGYIGTGLGFGVQADFWEYDQTSDTWTQKADFGGGVRYDAVGFSIGGKGYIGTGTNGNNVKVKDFWEYDPGINTWTQRDDFGGVARSDAVGLSIGDKGYIGTGLNGSSFSDFWEYDPPTNRWTQKADFAGGGRKIAVGFSIGGKGYIGTGTGATNGKTKDLWEYVPTTDTWTQKSDFGGGYRYNAVGFSVGGKGYLGTGRNEQAIAVKDFWEFDPTADTWTQKADFAGGEREEATGFSILGKGYAGGGLLVINDNFTDFWEYTPDGSGGSTCDVPGSFSTSNVTDTSATLSWDAVSGAVEYQVNYKVVGAAQWIVVRSTGNSKTLGSLTPGTNYVWRVRTVCSKSPLVASAYSGQVQFTTTEETTTTCDFATNLHPGESASPSEACDIPSNVTEVEILPTKAILRWDAVSGAFGYEIKYYEFYPEQGATLFVCTTRMRVTLENLQRNAFYRYSIRAICSQDPLIVSDYTSEGEFRTPRQPR